MNALEPMTYTEWLAANPDIEQEEVKCLDCNGTGKDECPHCGQEMDCEECAGTGKIKSARDIYQSQLRADKKRLEIARIAGMICVQSAGPHVD